MNEELLKIIKDKGLILEKELYDNLDLVNTKNRINFNKTLTVLERLSGQKLITISTFIKGLNSLPYEVEQYYPIYRLVTKKQRYEVLKRQSWNCNVCGVKLKYNSKSQWGEKVAHIDHIFPYSKRFEYVNGANKINENSNLQALCPNCNNSKGDKLKQ